MQTGVDGERLARGLAVATLSAPLLLLTQLVTGATGPSPRVLVGALLAVAAVTVLLDRPGRAAPGTARLSLVTGLAQLAGYAVLAAAAPAGGGCLPAVGRGAGLLLGLDLPATGCVTAGPYSLVGGAVTTVMVAAGILLSHAVLAGLGARLLTVAGTAARTSTHVATRCLHAVARAVARSAARLLRRLPVHPARAIGRPRTGGRRGRPAPLPVRHPARRPSRRGPPRATAPLPA